MEYGTSKSISGHQQAKVPVLAKHLKRRLSTKEVADCKGLDEDTPVIFTNKIFD